MAERSGKTYLVVGGNRGIGLALTKSLAADAENTVIGTTRDVQSEASTELIKLQTDRANVHVVAAEVTDLTTLQSAATKLKQAGVRHINTIIVVAGILSPLQDLMHVTPQTFMDGIKVNTLGTILVYQAFKEFLDEATVKTGEKSLFVSMSSNTAASREPIPWPNITYTTSKAALNHVSAQINFTNDNVVAIALHPGLVDTDMTAFGASSVNMTVKDLSPAFGLPLLTTTDSAKDILKIIEAPDVSKYGGKFVNYDGTELGL